MLLFLTAVLSDLIRLQFVANPDMFLSMEKDTKVILPISLIWLNELEDKCGIASRRFIDGDYYELFFCGMKLCYDTSNNLVLSCEENEHNTKWEMVPEGNDQYILRNTSQCITLFGNDTVEMKKCDGRDLNQRFRKIDYIKKPFVAASLEPSMAERELENKLLLKANEDFFRRESMSV